MTYIEKQFKLKHGRPLCRPASVSVMPRMETHQAATTISSCSRSAFTEYTKSVVQQLDE